LLVINKLSLFCLIHDVVVVNVDVVVVNVDMATVNLIVDVFVDALNAVVVVVAVVVVDVDLSVLLDKL
jgi:hypothetical protein